MNLLRDSGRQLCLRPARAWKPVVGYEGLYEVSDDGRVFCKRLQRERALVAHTDGYATVRLTKDGTNRRFYVHRLVGEAFNGPPNILHRETAHINGDKTDNRPANLKWVSAKENDTHKDIHGTRQAGEKHPLARLTERDVNAIRLSRKTRTEIAAEFGISYWTVKHLRAGGVKWKHLESAT